MKYRLSILVVALLAAHTAAGDTGISADEIKAVLQCRYTSLQAQLWRMDLPAEGQHSGIVRRAGTYGGRLARYTLDQPVSLVEPTGGDVLQIREFTVSGKGVLAAVDIARYPALAQRLKQADEAFARSIAGQKTHASIPLGRDIAASEPDLSGNRRRPTKTSPSAAITASGRSATQRAKKLPAKNSSAAAIRSKRKAKIPCPHLFRLPLKAA